MGVERLRDIPGFNIDEVAAAAGDDPGNEPVERLGLLGDRVRTRLGA